MHALFYSHHSHELTQNMSSFGCKNRYYTWTSKESKDWVEKKSTKIKIKIVSRS